MIARVKAEFPPAAQMTDPQTQTEYALHRMQLLARRPHLPCPDDVSAQNALFLALGLTDQPQNTKRLASLLPRCADAALQIGHGLSKQNLQQLRATLGSTADCIARLIAFFMRQYSKRGEDI